MTLKKRLKARTIIILIFLVLIAGLFLCAASLRITEITFVGNEKCKNEDMEDVLFQTEMDRNPFVFFIKSTMKEHKEIPFVEKYEVKMLSFTKFQVNVYEKSTIGYLKYMGECMYFDKDGIVVEVTTSNLEGITLVEGIRFNQIVVNEKIPVENEETFDTVLDITQLIDHYQIPADYVDISEQLEITLYIGEVRVTLGKDDNDLSEKINDLSSMVSVLENVPGELNMTEYSKSNKGYTFKKD